MPRHHAESRYEPRPGCGLTPAEAHVLALRDAGLTTREILKATRYSARLVARSLSMGSDGGSNQMLHDFRQGSAALAKALAVSGGHEAPVAPFRTPMGAHRLATLRRGAEAMQDRRIIVASAEPCPCCSVRGDHPAGCAHQRPDPEWLAQRKT